MINWKKYYMKFIVNNKVEFDFLQQIVKHDIQINDLYGFEECSIIYYHNNIDENNNLDDWDFFDAPIEHLSTKVYKTINISKLIREYKLEKILNV